MQVTPHVAETTGAMPPWREIARALRCPTLLITGDVSQDAIVTPEQAAEAKALNPLIEVAHVPDAGHNIRRENFDAYIAAVRAFLAKI
jgi:pimeloyl-ACP methyl ester carboxylesterase